MTIRFALLDAAHGHVEALVSELGTAPLACRGA